MALLSVAALLLIALAHRNSPAQPSHFLDKIVHSLHGPGFVGVALFVFAILRIYRRGQRNYIYAGLIAMGVGVLAEAAQIPGPRDAELSDLAVDAIGILGALGALALFDTELRYRIELRARIGLTVVTLTALFVSLVPTAWYSYAWIAQKRSAPFLVSFEHSWERSMYRKSGSGKLRIIDAPDGWPHAGLVAEATSSPRGDLLVLEPYADWSQSDEFSFLAASVDKSAHEIVVLIEDARPKGVKQSTRFRTVVTVGPAPIRIRIPLDDIRALTVPRPFDIGHINQVRLRLSNRVGGTKIIFDDFRLSQ